MISSLQPRRPKISNSQVSRPLNPQVSQPLNPHPNRTFNALIPSQIEAIQQPAAQPHPIHRLQYDSASQHPVFFTARMVKLPNGVIGAGASPVALGYQFEEARKYGIPVGKQKL